MFATHYYEEKLLNTFNGITFPGIGQLYVGLYMTNPTDTGTGGVEVNYTGYTRLPVTFTPPFEEGGGIGIRSTADLLWAAAPVDVGQVRYLGILDSQTISSGNMLLYAELTIPLDIRTGQQPSIYEGDILYYFTGDYSRDFMTRMLNVLRGQDLPGFTPYLALFDGDPETTGTELSGANYARPQMPFSAPATQAGGSTQIHNTSIVRFQSPADTWGNYAWDGIRDAPVGGNLITKKANPFPEVIQRNYVPQVLAGGYKAAIN